MVLDKGFSLKNCMGDFMGDFMFEGLFDCVLR